MGAGLSKVWLLRGVRRVGGTRSSVLMLVEPVTGVVLAALLLGQPFGAPELVGGAASSWARCSPSGRRPWPAAGELNHPFGL